jgi:hypothetical protein
MRISVLTVLYWFGICVKQVIDTRSHMSALYIWRTRLKHQVLL